MKLKFKIPNLDSVESAFKFMDSLLEESSEVDELCLFLKAFESYSLTAEILEGFQIAVMKRATKISIDNDKTIDICGTGGDGKNTINISTLSALTLAGMGYKVTKHGNGGFSSSCGSSDVLSSIGVVLPKNEEEVLNQLTNASIAFLHAPYFHPELKNIGVARKKYGKRTVFNLLGPLCNPACPSSSLLGVSDIATYNLYRLYLNATGRNISVIYDQSGYDEISLTNNVKVANYNSEYILSPETFGVPHQRNTDIESSGKEQSIASFLRIIEGNGTQEENRVIAANSAVAAAVVDTNQSLRTIFEEALKVLQSGSIKQIVKILRDAL